MCSGGKMSLVLLLCFLASVILWRCYSIRKTPKQLEDRRTLKLLLTKYRDGTEFFKSYTASSNGRLGYFKALCTSWIRDFLQYCYLSFSCAGWWWNSHWVENRLKAGESRYFSWLHSDGFHGLREMFDVFQIRPKILNTHHDSVVTAR